jgi:hypothetical protein
MSEINKQHFWDSWSGRVLQVGGTILGIITVIITAKIRLENVDKREDQHWQILSADIRQIKADIAEINLKGTNHEISGGPLRETHRAIFEQRLARLEERAENITQLRFEVDRLKEKAETILARLMELLKAKQIEQAK